MGALPHEPNSGPPAPRTPPADGRLRELLACWPDDPAAFAAACARVADWEALLRQAERHGVLGVLHEPLRSVSAGAALRPWLEQRQVLARVWGEHLLEALAAALEALAAAGVKTAALKGPVLSERLYGDAALRRSTDLDFLVAPADLENALAALGALGYQAEQGASARYHRQYHHHLCLVHPRWPAVELHFRVYVGYGAALAAEEFLARSLTVAALHGRGPGCRVLGPADEVLYLCLHAAGHDFERLAWLYDLKAYLRRHPDLDWPTVFDRARAAGVAGAVAFTLLTLRQRLGAHTPAGDVLAARHGRRAHAAGRLLALVEALPRPSAPAKLASLLLQAVLCDRPARGLWLLRHHLARVVRRRACRALPGLLPDDWSA
jgi:hypothetical protein